MNDSIEVELTEGAVKNGYIRVASRHPLSPEQYWAEDERDSSAQTFTLTADDGKTFNTYLLLNRSRFKQRFGAYFKERQILPGTRVQISKVAEGQYRMGFQMSLKTVRDYFEEYKKNPRADWMAQM